MKKQKREYSFDILRVISMIMVIVIHVANVYSRAYGTINNFSFLGSLIFNTISRISVPIFFMISGALLIERKFDKKKYFTRLKKYLIIIVIWDIIYLIWEKIYLGISYQALYKLITKPYRAHLWFLYTIIALYALQPILKIILDKSNKIGKVILLFLWFMLSSYSLINPHIAKSFTLFSYIGYFVIGSYIYKYMKEKQLKKYIPINIIIITLLLMISITLNYNKSIKKDTFYNLYFAYRTPFIILSSILFFIIIVSIFKDKEPNKIIIKLSDCSLGVYLIHGIYLDLTKKIWNYFKISSFIGIPIFSSLILICSTITVYLLKKNKYCKEIL